MFWNCIEKVISIYPLSYFTFDGISNNSLKKNQNEIEFKTQIITKNVQTSILYKVPQVIPVLLGFKFLNQIKIFNHLSSCRVIIRMILQIEQGLVWTDRTSRGTSTYVIVSKYFSTSGDGSVIYLGLQVVGVLVVEPYLGVVAVRDTVRGHPVLLVTSPLGRDVNRIFKNFRHFTGSFKSQL